MDSGVQFSLSGASLTYGRHSVLHDITLTIREGEKVALIGPSGAGKSSLLDLLWQQSPDNIALCPQESGLVDILSVYQNIYMGGLGRFSGVYNFLNLIRPWPARRVEVADIARALGVEDKLRTSPDKLSGGQRQRVALGRALYRQKSIFFGDEPVSSLDPEQGEQLLALILSRHQTAVVAIHNPALACQHFDRVIALKNGHVVGDWQTRNLDLAVLEAVYQNA